MIILEDGRNYVLFGGKSLKGFIEILQEVTNQIIVYIVMEIQ